MAKKQVIEIVENNPVFIQQSKDNMIKEMNTSNFSDQNPSKLSNIITKIDNVEKSALANKSPIAQFLIKATFNMCVR